MFEAGDPRWAFAELACAVARCQHDRRRAVGDGCTVVPAQRIRDIGRGQQLVGADRAGQLRQGVGEGCLTASRGHRRHRPLVPQAALDAQAGLDSGQAEGVRPQRRHEVGVELHRHDPAELARRRLAEAVDQGRVDLAAEQLHPGLVECPGGVHLDVRLGDRRERADRVDRGDERERAPGQVVRGARAPEADVGLGEPEAAEHLVEDRHQHLDAVGGAVGLAHAGRLREADYRDVTHVGLTGAGSRSRTARPVRRRA